MQEAGPSRTSVVGGWFLYASIVLSTSECLWSPQQQQSLWELQPMVLGDRHGSALRGRL